MARPKKRARDAAPVRGDFYEAEEIEPDEEKHAGQRYDRVDNYEYELPADFEDEEIDEETAFTEEDKKLYAEHFPLDDSCGSEGGADEDLLNSDDDGKLAGIDRDDLSPSEDEAPARRRGAGMDKDDVEDERLLGPRGSEAEEEDEDDEDLEDAAARQRRLLEDVAARGGRRRPRPVLSEAAPESEFNLPPSIASAGDAGGELSVADLVAGLGADRARLGPARKALERLGRRAAPVAAPLPDRIAARKERQAGYERTKEEVSKWQTLVKAHREAPTLSFLAGRGDAGRPATTAALVDRQAPADGMEAQVAALLAAAGADNGAAVEEAEEALALKVVGAEEAARRRDELARMRSLLFHQEAKLKRLAKIKSKDYHRRALRAAKAKAKKAGDVGDEDFLRLASEDAELKRARERLTLKHRNSSQWARRALKRGLTVMDQGTREALAEQLRLGQELRRKVERPDSGSDASTEASDASDASDGERAADGGSGGDTDAQVGGGRASSARVKAAALDLLQGGDEEAAPSTGLFALPFMRRALEKRKAAAQAQAEALLEDLEREGDEPADGAPAVEWAEAPTVGGRLRFGALQVGQAHAGGTAGEDVDADGSDGASDPDEDSNAKAERLGRRLARGDPAGSGLFPSGADEPGSSGRGARNAEAGGSSGSRAKKGPGGDGKKGKKKRSSLARGSGGNNGGEELDAASGGARGPEVRESAAAPEAADVHSMGPFAVMSPAARGDGAGAAPRSDVGSAAGGDGVLAAVARQRGSVANQDWLFAARPPGGAQAPAPDHKLDVKPSPEPSHKANGGTSAEAPAFVPAMRFAGARVGLVFRSGAQGVGYYQDSRGNAAHSPEAPGDGRDRGDAADTAREDAGEAEDDSGDEDVLRPVRGVELSQRELVARAFAGDDVAAEFAADKMAEAEAEAPDADAPSLLPGWGAWAGQQRMPAWMAAAQAKAKRHREAALAKRKDAKQAAVVISERWDRKAAKYGTPAVPYPFDSRATYDRSLRQPLGRDYNTDTAFRNLTRPAVLKEAGTVIPPLRYSQDAAALAKEAAAAKPGRRKRVAVVSAGQPKRSKR